MDSHLDRLYHHLAWANGRVLAALEQTGQAPEALRLLAHLLGAERVWLARIGQRPGAADSTWPELSLEQCRTLSAQSIAAFQALLRTATGDQLAAPVAYRNSRGHAYQTPLEDILIHVALHGVYHRGQIAARLRQAGQVPVNTDFIAFARTASGQTDPDGSSGGAVQPLGPEPTPGIEPMGM